MYFASPKSDLWISLEKNEAIVSVQQQTRTLNWPHWR